jgi:hypothetical protein
VQKLRAIFGGFSPIAITALVSILLLCTVLLARAVSMLTPDVAPPVAAASEELAPESIEPTPEWQQEALLLGLSDGTDALAATSTDHLSMIGPMIMGEIVGSYAAIRERGNYTKQDLQAAAQKIAQYMKAVVSYDTFDNGDFRTTDDTSTERVRAYRDSLQQTLAPLSTIPGAEYEIYAKYDQTNDPEYLAQLKNAANLYRTAADNASAISVPSDAVNFHRDVLNSLRAFSSVLDGLVDHADDPFASIALMNTYTEKEQAIYDSYNRMRTYYAHKNL